MWFQAGLGRFLVQVPTILRSEVLERLCTEQNAAMQSKQAPRISVIRQNSHDPPKQAYHSISHDQPPLQDTTNNQYIQTAAKQKSTISNPVPESWPKSPAWCCTIPPWLSRFLWILVHKDYLPQTRRYTALLHRVQQTNKQGDF